VGVSIGAGANHWQGVHGYVMDSIISVRLITADARLIEVSEDSHPDLFWAIRGAGHNFGVITSATYRLYPPTNNDEILVVDAAFLPRANTSYFEALGEISRNQPPNLSHFSVTAFNQTIQSVSSPLVF
jgi:FAD/FMN-containing dehydrogenase